MRFRLLGPLEVEAAGVSLPLRRRRERCLLGVLLLEANRVVPVDRLAELLWDGDPPDRARPAIHSHVSRLRTALTAGTGDTQGFALATVSDGYRMELDPQAVDAHQFRTRLDRAAGTADLARRVDQLRAALDLWRGPLLDNAASAWLRDRLGADLTERRLTATEDLVSASLALRREREVLPELAQAAGAHPGRESLVALHMRALYQAGRRTDALGVYARARSHLADELGLDPAPALRELHQAILRDQLAVPDPPEGFPAGAYTTPSVPAVKPLQLPAGVAGFTGRTVLLDQLDTYLPAGDGAASVVVTVIGGSAGVGKTALALHWAHRVAHRFPDGQLYVNLRGFDPGGVPVTPGQAVRGFFDALQVTPQRMPADLDAGVGLYRSLLAGLRVLVVLDNARDADQVRPLLPATAGCLAVVTSRNQLADLVVTEAAHPLTIDLLPTGEARTLLDRRLGAGRLAGEPDAVDEIIDRCAGLPLALAIVAARAAAHPRFPLQALAEELRAADGRLDALSGPGTATDLRAVFSWSYRALGTEAARLFRLLGLHPGPDFDASAAAYLAGTTVPHARRLLTELTHAHLTAEHLPGRFALHDLLRAYAAELAAATEPEHHRRVALRRMFDHYRDTIETAVGLLDPRRLRGPSPTPQAIADREQALAWFIAEHWTLRTAVTVAERTGLETHSQQLDRALGFLEQLDIFGEVEQLGIPDPASSAGQLRQVHV